VSETITKRIKENIQASKAEIEVPYKVDKDGNIIYKDGMPVPSDVSQIHTLEFLSGEKMYNFAMSTLTPQEAEQLRIDAEYWYSQKSPKDLFDMEYNSVEDQMKIVESDIKLSEKLISEASKSDVYKQEEIQKMFAGSAVEKLKEKLKTLQERKSTLDKIREAGGIEEYVKTQGKVYATNTYIEKYMVELARGMAYENRKTAFEDNPFFKAAIAKEELDIQRERNRIAWVQALKGDGEKIKEPDVEISVNYSKPTKTSKEENPLEESVKAVQQLENEIKSTEEKLKQEVANYNKTAEKKIENIEKIGELSESDGFTIPKEIKNLHKKYKDAKASLRREEGVIASAANKVAKLMVERSKPIKEDEKNRILNYYDGIAAQMKWEKYSDQAKGDSAVFYNLVSSGKIYSPDTNDVSKGVLIYYSPDYEGEKPLKVYLDKHIILGTEKNQYSPLAVEITVYGKKHEKYNGINDEHNMVLRVIKDKAFRDKIKEDYLREIYTEGQDLEVVIAQGAKGSSTKEVFPRIVGKLKTLMTKDKIINQSESGDKVYSENDAFLPNPAKATELVNMTTYVDEYIKRGGSIAFTREKTGQIIARMGDLKFYIPQEELLYIAELMYNPNRPEDIERFNAILLEPQLLSALKAFGTTYGDGENKYGRDPYYAYFKADSPSLISNYPTVKLDLGKEDSRTGEYKVVAYDITASLFDEETGVYKEYSPKVYVKAPDGKIITLYPTNHKNAFEVVYYINKYTPEQIKNALITALKNNS
jgi:septum formation inhibitor MinC